jgi:hypothetical protein
MTPSREDVAAVHVLRGTAELETNDIRELAEGDSWISEEPRRAKLRALSDAVVAVISIDTTPLVAA